MAFFFTLVFMVVYLVSVEALPAELVDLHVEKILMFLALVTAIPSLLRQRTFRVPQTVLLVLFFAVTLISNPLHGWFGGSVSVMQQMLPPVVAFIALIITCTTMTRFKVMAWMMIGVSLWVTGVFFYLHLHPDPNSRFVMYEGVEGGVQLARYHGLGNIADPNDTAQLFVAVLPLLFIGWKERSAVGKLVLAVLPAIALLLGIFMTHSRGAVLAMAVMLFFAFRKKLGYALSLVTAGAGAVALALFGISGGRAIGNDDGGRVMMWATGLHLFVRNPLFGIGWGRFSDFMDTGLTAHNSYVLCLAELGIAGYLSWMGILVFTFYQLYGMLRGLAQKREERALAAAAAPGMMPMTRISYGASGKPQMDPEEKRDRLFESAAKALEASLIGFLAAAFFLSRTYVLHLYILLAMATSLVLMYQRVHGVEFPVKPMLRRTMWMTAASIALFFVIVRLNPLLG